MYVETGIGDLKLVVDKIDVLLINQRNDYLIAFDEAKMRLPKNLRQPIFRDLIGHVTPYALQKIYIEYRALTGAPNVLSRCSKAYTTKSGLPCKHVVQERMFNPPGVLKLEDVHPHWKFVREAVIENHASDSSDDSLPPIDPLLLVQDPAVCKPKGRPVGALNRTRQEHAFDISTHRELSQFEHVEAAVQDQEQLQNIHAPLEPLPRRGRSAARGAPRGRARAGRRGRAGRCGRAGIGGANAGADGGANEGANAGANGGANAGTNEV